VYDLLTIEDRPHDVEVARTVLRERNHRVRLNSVSVLEAMDFVNRKGKYADAPVADLVLIDVAQDADVIDVLTRLRGHFIWRLIPVIAFTRDDEQTREFYELGANACIRKPSGPEELAATITAIDSFWFAVAQLLPPEPRLRSLIEEAGERGRAQEA
jgi:CheY-like chemotaxis protein